MNRTEMLRRAIARREPWDLLVIGGGATGVGVAVDAASRGYEVLLVERGDFGVGTSSRSTKLVHGGVRYLQQGHVGLVMEALRERGRLRRNAPHLVRDLPFVLPCYSRWEIGYYGLGLTTYDLLAGQARFGRSRILNAADVRRRLPTVQTHGLRGGVVYHDGQFDDARLLIHLARTAVNHGATVLNYASVIDFLPLPASGRGPGGGVNASGPTTPPPNPLPASGRGNVIIDGAIVRDAESGTEWRASARVVVNAAGPFCDAIRRLADPASSPIVAASQGSHIVLDRSFLPGDSALLVPRTPDGRVLFVIPWHGHTLVGTTDVAVPDAPIYPRSTTAEVDFILETAGRYLSRRPRREDVLSTWAGIRPLVKAGGRSTAKLSRDHTIRQDAGRLLTITGGKWTTYRHMAEDCVNRAAIIAGLPRRPCRTRELRLHGYHADAATLGDLAVHGSDAAAIKALMDSDAALASPLHASLPYCAAEVVWAARFEMARTVEDALARRTRSLFLNASAAIEAAPGVAQFMAGELGKDATWEDQQVREFTELAYAYFVGRPS